MNILIINKYYFISGGPERYMFSLISALEDDGHKVVPLALNVDRNQKSPYSHTFLNSPFGYNYAKLGETKLSYLEKLKLMGRAIYYPAAKRAVARIIEKHNIDVVYLLNICNYISPSVIAGAKAMGVRVVMRLSDFNFICASYVFHRDGKICTECKRNIMRAVRYKCVRGSISETIARSLSIAIHRYSRIYHKVDAFICPSQLMTQELVDFGLRRDKIYYLPSFVKSKNGNVLNSSGGYVLNYGRLSREKGIDILIKAWNLLGDNAPNLRIIGSGPEEQLLRRMVSRYELSNVEFIPFLKHEEITEQVKNCAFVVVPSVCHDNAPMSVIESMSMGKVVIASRVGGLPDQIQDGSTGILVPPGNPEALAKAVITLVRQPGELEIMGNAAQEWAELKFSQQAHVQKLVDIFKAESLEHVSKGYSA